MKNPYESLPASAFWRMAVAEPRPLEISGIWTPKHPLVQDDAVVTAGSCFAQHIGRALAARGYHWHDSEPGPSLFPEKVRHKYGYGLFSFRTGNIYTVQLLKQWIDWAFDRSEPPQEVWEKEGRFFDPFRPGIEPEGFPSVDELLRARRITLRSMRRALRRCERFVFTLGLTEGWVNRETGAAYPMCPGTLAGMFDPRVHEFVNGGFNEIASALERVMNTLVEQNERIRFLLTVSPVPLTATASGQHVLAATSYSKSTLRSVAGHLAATRDDTDYFPAYELITGQPFRGMFYEANLRSVTSAGVEFVMDTFFRCLIDTFGEAKPRPALPHGAEGDDDVVCEEAMLDAFGRT